MFRVWTGSADDAAALGRELENHLNEFAEEVISVSFAVDGPYYALAVYRAIEIVAESESSVVAVAEQIIDHAQQ